MKIEDLERDLGPLTYSQMIENLKTISKSLEILADDVYDMELDDIYSDISYYQYWIEQVKEALKIIYIEGEE